MLCIGVRSCLRRESETKHAITTANNKTISDSMAQIIPFFFTLKTFNDNPYIMNPSPLNRCHYWKSVALVIERLLKEGYYPMDYQSSDKLIKKGIYFKLQ